MLAIILSVFIAMVLVICFVLDHCRRQRRYAALKESNEADYVAATDPPLENGHSPMADMDMRRGQTRPKSKLRSGILVTNGSVGQQISRSLDEINHNMSHSSERLSLIPLTASLGSVNQIEETSFLLQASMSDGLPPPPDELLHDSPHQTRVLFHDSDSSTISIPPPPQGFGDSDNENAESNLNPEVIITSPTNGSVFSAQTFPRSGPLLKITPKLNNNKRLNNEMHHGSSTLPRDGNLLQNHVSIQTNDLSQGYDKLSRIENPGQVSMRSPQFELPDLFCCPDQVSEVGYLDSIDEMIIRKLKANQQLQQQANNQSILMDLKDDVKSASIRCSSPPDSKRGGTPEGLDLRGKAKKGQLMVLKSGNAECARRNKANHNANCDSSTGIRDSNPVPRYEESERDRSFEPSGSQSERSSGLTEESHYKSGVETLQAATTNNDEASSSRKAQTFAVPKHKCGLGHSHSCVCTPLRTGSNSYICCCLEKAKNKETVCCVEDCPDQAVNQFAETGRSYSPVAATGKPYSSARPLRGAQTETLKRKNNRDVKLSSSLTDLSQAHAAKDTSKRKFKTSTLPRENGSAFTASPASATLPRIHASVDQKPRDGDFSMSLDRRWHPANGKTTKSADQPTATVKSTKKARFERTNSLDRETPKSARSKIPSIIRSAESSDSSDKSDGSIDALQSKSLPTSPTRKARLKNGKVRLSPISEDSIRSQRNKAPGRGSLPRFKIQVVQSLHTNKHHPIKEV